MEIQLDDLVYSYPPQFVPGIQTLITSKKEFSELSGSGNEQLVRRGQLFKHQKLIRRFMLVYDRLLLIHRTGTGKTCAAFGTSEQFKIGMVNAVVDFINVYLKPQRTNIKRIYVLTKGKQLISELKRELACKCTSGEYLTDKVENARTKTAQRQNLSREIGKFYDVLTYGQFAKQILTKNLNDESIKQQFSNSLFIIDEVQNLIVDELEEYNEDSEGFSKKKAEKQKITYSTIKKVFHLVENSKIMLLSATPMINDYKDIIPVMNLILPMDKQLTVNIMEQLLSTSPLENIEQYFRGLISYVRESNLNVNVNYQGELIDNTYVKIYPDVMSQHQSEYYYNLLGNARSAFSFRERQAANFVFPNRTIGKEGFSTYVRKLGPDQFEPTNNFAKNIDSIDKLAIYSRKFANIVKLCSEKQGSCFVYSNFITGSGSALLGICFAANGYQQFYGNQDFYNPEGTGNTIRRLCATEKSGRTVKIFPARRFALLTSETPDAQSILEAFNSPENRNGEYIKVLIGSPVTQIGINLSNVVQVHIVGPGWNRSNTYQAISRAIRATSHDQLLDDEIQKLLLQRINPENARISVDVYQHASIGDINGEMFSTVDVSMYVDGEEKDRNIRRVERYMKQVAIDCQIHRNRNIRPDDIDGTPQCDYDVCEYKCYDPPPIEIDYSSYDVLYADEIVESIIDDIRQEFYTEFSININILYDKMSKLEYSKKYVDMAIEKLVTNKIAIIDRFGYQNYLKESGSTIFLQREYPLVTAQTGDYSSLDYTQNITADYTTPLEKYVENQEKDNQIDIIKRIINVQPGSEEFNGLIDLLTLQGKVSILEEVIYDSLNNGENDYSIAIKSKFCNYIYSTYEPLEELRQSLIDSANVGKGRGRKRNENTVTRVKRLKGNIELPTSGAIIYLHTLYISGESYNMINKFIKADGKIRLLDTRGGGWRDLEKHEIPVYNSIIQSKIQQNMDQYTQSPIYGIIPTDGKFRLIDTLNENVTASIDSRKELRGRVCTTIKKEQLLETLWRLYILDKSEISQDELNVNWPINTTNTLEALRIHFRSSKNEPKIYQGENELEKYQFFLTFSSHTSKKDICSRIQNTLNRKNLIFRENATCMT